MRPIRVLACLFALALASCSTISGLVRPGPETSVAVVTVKADVATLQTDALAASAEIPGLTALVASVGSGDYVSAAAQLVTVAPALYSHGGALVADGKRLVADLRALLSAAAAGKSAGPMIDLANAERILSGSGAAGAAKVRTVGPAPANAPGVTTFSVGDREWQETRGEHSVLVERLR